MNTKIILSAFSILASLALVSTGAYATFTSSNTNSGNSFGSGTLTLSVNTESPISTGVFHVTGAKPGDAVGQVLNLKNEGSVDASSLLLTNIVSTPSTGLGDVLTLNLYRDGNNNDTNGMTAPDADDVLVGSAHLTSPAWTNINLGSVLNHGDNRQYLAIVTFDSDSDNTYQSKSVSFDLNFQANQ